MFVDIASSASKQIEVFGVIGKSDADMKQSSPMVFIT